MPPQFPASLSSAADLYDEQERTRIVAAARALYLSQGIAGVSTADLSRYLRMPEHAVRRWFASPEPLVSAVVQAHIEAVRTELGSHREHCSTAVEELLVLRNWVSSELRASIGPFFQQLEAHYPAVWQHWHAHITSFPMEHLRANLRRGVQQGFYQPDLAIEDRVAAWFGQLAAVRRATPSGPDAADLHYTMLNTLLADIATPAGALVARRLQEAAPYY